MFCDALSWARWTCGLRTLKRRDSPSLMGVSSKSLRNRLSLFKCFSCSSRSGGKSLSRGYPSGTEFRFQEETGSSSLSGSKRSSLEATTLNTLKPCADCAESHRGGFVGLNGGMSALLDEHPMTRSRQG